jgi:RNAse (barnase) inhibitor barstar
MTLQFIDKFTQKVSDDSFVIRIPAGIQTKADLLSMLKQEGKFPSYFGHNWDALSECLSDLSWISNRKVVIVHEDLPLSHSLADCKNYLEVLEESIYDWLSTATVAETNTENDELINHELQVIFPVEKKHEISTLLSNK